MKALSADELPLRHDRRKWFILAVIISVIVHVVLFELSKYQKLSGKIFYDLVLGKPFKVQRVELDPPKPVPLPVRPEKITGSSVPAPEFSISAPPSVPAPPKAPVPSAPPPRPSTMKMPEQKPPKPGSELPPAQRDSAAEAKQAVEVLAIQKQQLKEQITVETAPGALPGLPSGSDKSEAMASTTARGEGTPAVPGTGKMFGGPNQGEDAGSGALPLPLQALPEVEAAKKIPLREGDKVLRENIAGERPYEQLHPWMAIDLYTYEEKKNGRMDGYFMLRITAKENNVLKVIPKDVIFMLDSSSSIGQSRLYEFKSAVNRSLRDLNAGDRFNLLTFKKRSDLLSKRFLPYSAESMREVKEFLGDIDSTGRTDIFRGLMPLTELRPEQDRMRMAILMSDGVATEGEKNATRIINQFTARNQGVTSLFALSGGRDVNKFLQEFLAYQNQGLTLYVPQEREISGQFHKFYLSIKDPLLMDLDFKFAGVQAAEVYPRNLPHIYQNKPLQIYGRYDPATEKVFSMQILGQSFGTTKELLARQSFDKAKKGTRQIAVDWGKQKTYHLIGQTLRNDSPELEAEIIRLSREYGIDLGWVE